MHHDPDRSWITDSDHPKGMHPFFYQFWLEGHLFFGSSCIIQDNLFYLTVNNKFIIGREIGKKGKGEVCITTDTLNLNAMWSFDWEFDEEWQTLPSPRLNILSGFVSCYFVLHTTNKRGPLSREYISLILAICGMLALFFFFGGGGGLKSPLYKKLFLNSHLIVWYLCLKEII